MGDIEFLRYCNENKDSIPDSYRVGNVSVQGVHKKFLNYIFDNPQLIGLRRIDKKFKEVVLLNDCAEVGCIDAVFFGDHIYICEAKVSNNHESRMINQLQDQYQWIRERFDICPVMIGAQRFSNGPIKRRIIPPHIKDLLTIR